MKNYILVNPLKEQRFSLKDLQKAQQAHGDSEKEPEKEPEKESEKESEVLPSDDPEIKAEPASTKAKTDVTLPSDREFQFPIGLEDITLKNLMGGWLPDAIADYYSNSQAEEGVPADKILEDDKNVFDWATTGVIGLNAYNLFNRAVAKYEQEIGERILQTSRASRLLRIAGTALGPVFGVFELPGIKGLVDSMLAEPLRFQNRLKQLGGQTKILKYLGLSEDLDWRGAIEKSKANTKAIDDLIIKQNEALRNADIQQDKDKLKPKLRQLEVQKSASEKNTAKIENKLKKVLEKAEKIEEEIKQSQEPIKKAIEESPVVKKEAVKLVDSALIDPTTNKPFKIEKPMLQAAEEAAENIRKVDAGKKKTSFVQFLKNIGPKFLKRKAGMKEGVIEEQMSSDQLFDFMLNAPEKLKNLAAEKEQFESEEADKIVKAASENFIENTNTLLNVLNSEIEELSALVRGDADLQESKIKITKSKLIDLIFEQVKEQTQTVDVTKDQLVALVVQEAFKQINRKK